MTAKLEGMENGEDNLIVASQMLLIAVRVELQNKVVSQQEREGLEELVVGFVEATEPKVGGHLTGKSVNMRKLLHKLVQGYPEVVSYSVITEVINGQSDQPRRGLTMPEKDKIVTLACEVNDLVQGFGGGFRVACEWEEEPHGLVLEMMPMVQE